MSMIRIYNGKEFDEDTLTWFESTTKLGKQVSVVLAEKEPSELFVILERDSPAVN